LGLAFTAEGVVVNILVITDAFVPERFGGVAKSVSNETEWLAARGHRVVVVTRRLTKDSPLHQNGRGYEVYRYPAPEEGSRWNRLYPFFTLAMMPKLVRKLCSRYRFDLAYVHGCFQLRAFLGMRVGVPVVGVFHASGYDELRVEISRRKYGRAGSLAARPVSRWMRSLEGRSLECAGSILVRSQSTRRRLIELYPWLEPLSIFRVPLGVDTNRFRPGPQTSKHRDSFQLPERRPLILSVRRLAARMGLENLVLAMRQVAAAFPRARLTIAGKGYLEPRLRAMIAQQGVNDNVSLAGFVPETDLPDLYRAAELVLMPTRELEGFGLSTLEALACGTPVVATPIGANVEVLEGLGCEHLFEGCGTDQIAAGLIAWLRKRPDQALREQCRQYCEQHFGHEVVSQALERCFQQTVAEHSARSSGSSPLAAEKNMRGTSSTVL
jgi:glycosyltransferase involved in cell wall biosynthesis